MTAATQAALSSPSSVDTDCTGDLFFTHASNTRVREVVVGTCQSRVAVSATGSTTSTLGYDSANELTG